jgi:4-amino-4-deoxy-L-arabinose transferase-like glycosyltransferase
MAPTRQRLLDFISHNWLIIAIILFAAFLRLFYYMGVVRGDDFSYAYFAHEFSRGATDQLAGEAGAKRIGLYAPVAILFRLFGENEFVATLFPLLASLAAVFFIYKIASLLAGKNAGLVSAFLWSVFSLDIFMATQLDPESPLAMASAGSIYFLLVANRRKKNLERLGYYFESGAFLAWAFLIKPSVAPLAFVIIAILVYENFPEIKKAAARLKRLPRRVLVPSLGVLVFSALIALGFVLSKQPWPIVMNKLELTAYDTSPTWMLGWTNPIQQEDVGGNWAEINKRNVFTPPPQADMLTTAAGPQRVRLFDLYVLTFLVAAATAVLQREKSATIPFVWFGILFFYLEWGPFPRSLSADALIYTPLTHWIATDNFLYISVPMVIVMGIFIARGLKERNVIMAIVVSMLLAIPAAFLLESMATRSLTTSFLDAALVCAIAGAVLSPFVLLGKNKPRPGRSVYLAALIPLIGLSSLLPSPHYHVWDFQKEQERRDNLRAVHAYLLEHAELPIRASDYALQLDVYTAFQYGFSLKKNNMSYPKTRMTGDNMLIREIGGYLLKQGCGNTIFKFKDWPVAEFGDPNSPECISLIRWLPFLKASLEMAEAKRKALNLLTSDAIRSYISAAANTRLFFEFVDALSLMVTYHPEDAPITQASGILQTHRLVSINRISRNLVSLFGQEEGAWIFGPELTPDHIEVDGEPVLAVEINRKTDEIQPISLEWNLKPKTAYILEVELKSFAPYDLLRFPGYTIPDSFADSWNRDLEWTAHSIAFVTPDWPEAEKQVTIELARVYDRGSLWFRALDLKEVVRPKGEPEKFLANSVAR